MAMYHFSATRIGGNGGRSSVGAAAYHSGKKYHNKYDGVPHDYTKRRGSVSTSAYHSGKRLVDGNLAHDFTYKSEIIHNEIMLPKHAPEIFRNGETLWNSVESAKKQYNEQTSRMVVVALPNELTPDQNIELVRNFVRRAFVSDGMCADFSIHAGHVHDKKDETYPFQDLAIQKNNPHAHIQLTTRPLNENGTWANKTRKEYIIDKNGDKIRLKSGKGWRSRNVNLTDWEKPETLLKWRENWALTVNREFERLGIDARIDHRSLKDQGIDRTPTTHMGHKAWNLEKKGIKTEIGDKNRAIMVQNKELERETLLEIAAEHMYELKQKYIAVDKEISAIKQNISEMQRNKFATLAQAEDIGERAANIQSLRIRLSEMKATRQDTSIIFRSYEQALNYFKREFNVAPEQASEEIKRLESKARELTQKLVPMQKRLPPLLIDRDTLKSRYHQRRLLADISRDRERILARLEQLEKETRDKLTPKENMARLKIVSGLDDKKVEREMERDRYKGR